MIPSPVEITLNAVTLDLIRDATQAARQINELRPLPEDVLKNVQQALLGERVYNSNAIEGSTLTLRETRAILEGGAGVDVGRQREAMEALNLGRAIAEVQQIVAERDAWSDIQRFLNVHRTLMKGVNDDIAGAIRTVRVTLLGARHQPPNPSKLHALLADFFSNLKDATDVEPVLLATWAHWAIARIHPFQDGNGRMARLWQDLILFGSRSTAAVIRHHDRDEYYRALTVADEGDFNPLVQLVARSLIRTLQVYVNAQREADVVKSWAAKIVGESHARRDEHRQLEYLRWARRMEQLRDAFERCAAQVTSLSDGSIDVQVRSYEIIDQATWETLRSGSRAPKTWYFWIDFRRGEARSQYCFFFGRHDGVIGERDLPRFGPSVCLLVSEQQGDGDAKRLTEMSSGPVTLRELLVVGDKLIRRQVGPPGESVYDIDVKELRVAQSFVQEVLLHQSS